jgi:AMP-binding enzyme
LQFSARVWLTFGKSLTRRAYTGLSVAACGAARKLTGNRGDQVAGPDSCRFLRSHIYLSRTTRPRGKSSKGPADARGGARRAVGLHLPNTPHFVIRFFAVLIAGGRVVNFSPLAALRELEYQLTDAETQVMIPANRGLEGHREIPDAGGLEAR